MTPRRTALTALVVGLAVFAAVWCACSAPPGPDSRSAYPAPAFLAGEDSARWVKKYDPTRAWNGYTLALYGRRIPMLLDMNGTVVHSWPEARVKSRVRLLPDGSLLGLALGRAIVEYDWDGNLVWETPINKAIPHHDVIRLTNGNTMVLVLKAGQRTDDILEINHAGQTVWEWRSSEHLADYYDPEMASGEITHLNSVQELPANKWFDDGDPRFRPGNLLISARNLNTIFLIDRETGDVVWAYAHELDRQHEALMVAKGLPQAGNILLFDNGYAHELDRQHEALMVAKGPPQAGNILLFDNGYASTHVYRQSRILEISPHDNSIVWSYDAEGFYSPTGGIQQPLPNGNILISSTRGLRAFEVNRAGRTVWEWAPPFEPNRPSRVAYDHCPQLAALAAPAERRVQPAAGYRHVDPRTYVYARKGAIAQVRIDGTERRALKEKNSCRKVLVPAQADILLGYGINRRGARGAGHTGYTARFRLTLTSHTPSTNEVLLDQALDMTQTNWAEHTIALDDYAYRWIDFCLSIERTGSAISTQTSPIDSEATKFAFWTNPIILPREQRDSPLGHAQQGQLTPEELQVQRRHLKALGYID